MPGRIATHWSASCWAVSDSRGSMTTTRVWCFFFVCWVTKTSPPPLIRVSMGSLPKITTRSEFFQSSWLLVSVQPPYCTRIASVMHPVE